MVGKFDGYEPQIHSSSWVAPSASVIGDVMLCENVSVWFGAVLRADVQKITIAKGSNIQDNATLHVDNGASGGLDAPISVGEFVSVGHNCVIHGCCIERCSLIGMGAILLNGVRVGECSIVGAGSLLTQNKVFPPYSLIMGSPAKVIRKLSDLEVENITKNAELYIELSKKYILSLS